jgi:hypothetical protein
MLHAFEHFVFCFKASVFKPTYNSAATQPETDFQEKENKPHDIKVKPGKRFGIKKQLNHFNNQHTD